MKEMEAAFARLLTDRDVVLDALHDLPDITEEQQARGMNFWDQEEAQRLSLLLSVLNEQVYQLRRHIWERGGKA